MTAATRCRAHRRRRIIHSVAVAGTIAVTVAANAVVATPASAAQAPADPAAAPRSAVVEFTPSPVDPGSPPLDAGRQDGDAAEWWDLGGQVRDAINDWLAELVTSALTPVLDLLGRTVLATPQVADPGRVADLWRLSLGMVDTAFVLFVLVGGTVVMGHETIQTRYTAKEIAPRLVLAVVAANLSLWLAGQAITIANALSQGLLGDDVAVGDLATRVDQLLAAQAATGGTALLVIGLVAAVLAVVVVAVYVLRVAIVVLLVASAPLALACHALPQTEPVARVWWRALTACLAVQVGQALVVIAGVRVFFAPDGRATVLGLGDGGTLVDLLVMVCLLWLLLRIPIWAAKAVLSGRGGIVVRTVKYYVAARSVRAVLAR